jgi:hypothetical protein
MNSKLIISAVAVLSIAALFSFAIVIGIEQASASTDNEKQGGPKEQKNNGQCKQNFNDNVCKKFHTGSG